MDRYSNHYAYLASEKVGQKIKDSLCLAKFYFYKEQYSFVQMPNGNIGICAKVCVPVGSSSDLKQHEPILVEICGNDIEESDLKIYPDRTNFPYELFPHINFPVDNMPPTLCLTRENFRDWYAEHTFEDYIKLVSEWYKDAATGNLIKINGEDFFEPFRPRKSDAVVFKVPYEDSFIEKCKIASTLCFNVVEYEENVYKCDIFDNNYKQKGSQIGILLTKPASEICRSWFIRYPNNIKELCEFIVNNGFKLDFDIVRKALRENEECKKILIQFAFPRPFKILGKNTIFDYLAFLINKNDLIEYNEQGYVMDVNIYDFATVDLAKHLANTPKSIADKHILILGCGAVGSKLATHLYRSGLYKITICDNDYMQPHNVCRHALLKSHLFQKKVVALKNELDQMFVDYRKLTINDVDVMSWLPEQDLSKYDLIIDATASASVFRIVDKLMQNTTIPCVRFSLSDAGKLGVLYQRCNITNFLSDYYMYLAHIAVDNEDLSQWICNEIRYNNDLVRVGEGCHSNTMIISDDIISTHTAIASNIIRNMFEGKQNNIAFLSFTDVDYIGQVFTEKFVIPHFVTLTCEGDPKWEVRIPIDVLNSIHRYARKTKKEVGGYMMGNVDRTYKRIYVLHHFVPEDSYQHTTKLALGRKGWKNEYNKVTQKTSNVLDYIGDWHSHPKGSLQMSTIDIITNYAIKREEIPGDYGLCLITNGNETKAHLLKPNVNIIIASTDECL